jgi:prepilin-type N-terminal cleavage/methylation domain-containing protein
MVRRSAFTLIELIFAIIIIAIVVVSMPLMMKTNEEAIEANIAQEAIFASSAKMMQVLSYPWDANATDSTNPNTYGKVVDVTGVTSEYNRSNENGDYNTSSSYRVGHILQDNHRRFHDATLATTHQINAITSTQNPTALNNANQSSVALEIAGVAATKGSSTGYKNAYKMDVDVSFIPDTPSSTFNFASEGSSTKSNMKLIKVTIKNSDDKILTVLRSYSANIGEFDFAKRRFE